MTLFVLDQVWLSILPFSRNSAIEWLSHLPTEPVNTIKTVQKFLLQNCSTMTVKDYMLSQKVPFGVLVILADVTENEEKKVLEVQLICIQDFLFKHFNDVAQSCVIAEYAALK